MIDHKQQPEDDEVPFTITPLSVMQLAGLYGINYRTMVKWLAPFAKDIGPKNGRIYTNVQVKIILEKLGVPDQTIER